MAKEFGLTTETRISFCWLRSVQIRVWQFAALVIWHVRCPKRSFQNYLRQRVNWWKAMVSDNGPTAEALSPPRQKLSFGEVTLRFERIVPGDPSRDFVPYY